MNISFKPPFTNETAAEAIKLGQAVLNSGSNEEKANMFSDDCVWRDGERHITGRISILAYLNQKETRVSHYQVRAELWSHSFFRVSASFQSEWQRTDNNRWYRSSGHLFVRLDQSGLIKEFCISADGSPISTNQKSIGFNR